jgi:hypothetical protein
MSFSSFLVDKISLAGRITLHYSVPCGVTGVLITRGYSVLEATGWGTATAMSILLASEFIMVRRIRAALAEIEGAEAAAATERPSHQDHPRVVAAEEAFIVEIASAVMRGASIPECYAELGRVCSSLKQARRGFATPDEVLSLQRDRWEVIKTVRAHGPTGDLAIDDAVEFMEREAAAARDLKV